MPRNLIVLTAVLVLSGHLNAQDVILAQLSHTATPSTVTISVKGAANSAPGKAKLIFQRYNEFDLTVGEAESHDIVVTPGGATTYVIDEASLKGAAYVTYSVMTSSAPTRLCERMWRKREKRRQIRRSCRSS